MSNLITNNQFCDVVGSSNGVDKDSFSSKCVRKCWINEFFVLHTVTIALTIFCRTSILYRLFSLEMEMCMSIILLIEFWQEWN